MLQVWVGREGELQERQTSANHNSTKYPVGRAKGLDLYPEGQRKTVRDSKKETNFTFADSRRKI